VGGISSLTPMHRRAEGMKDVQNSADTRGIAIDQVGITNLRYPISVKDRDGKPLATVADVSMSVHLPHHFKGTHMSRFLEVLLKNEDEITLRKLPTILHELKERLDAESAHMEVSFPHFIDKAAPVSGARAKVCVQCTFSVSCNGRKSEIALRVVVPVTTLCPCSKEISDYGAHNQRGHVTIEVRPTMTKDGWAWIWIEELVEIAEKSASAPVYALLKRPDERHVTMQAHDNPVFVEDLVRNVALLLKDDSRISWFEVQAVNQESIHAHDAFAKVTWKRQSRSRRQPKLRKA
jgi:GTP cyclohydrolase IB